MGAGVTRITPKGLQNVPHVGGVNWQSVFVHAISRAYFNRYILVETDTWMYVLEKWRDGVAISRFKRKVCICFPVRPYFDRDNSFGCLKLLLFAIYLAMFINIFLPASVHFRPFALHFDPLLAM